VLKRFRIIKRTREEHLLPSTSAPSPQATSREACSSIPQNNFKMEKAAMKGTAEAAK
jgi:hypothetical protein